MIESLSSQELAEIVADHQKWLNNESGGKKADLGRADLERANLNKANLERAMLSKAKLYRADLEGADLRGADLRGAELYGADLRGADLRGADFYGADLRVADLRDILFDSSTNFRGAQLEGAKVYERNLQHHIEAQAQQQTDEPKIERQQPPIAEQIAYKKQLGGQIQTHLEKQKLRKEASSQNYRE